MSNANVHFCRVRIFNKNETTSGAHNQGEEAVQYVGQDCFLIGNSADADVKFTGSGVIGHHLLVKVKGSELVLEDLGSTQGTNVGGKPVPLTPFTYKPGDMIQLGHSDRLLTIELFEPAVSSRDQADDIVRVAHEKAREINMRALEMKNEIESQLSQAQSVREEIESTARAEAERIITAAQRQIAENARKAIEDRHSQEEALQQQAKAELDKVIRQNEEEGSKVIARAKSAAADLIESARSEVKSLLDDAQAKAEAKMREGTEAKQAALKFSENLQAQIKQLSGEIDRLKADSDQAKTQSAEAIQKKQMMLRQAEVIEKETKQLQDRFLVEQQNLKAIEQKAEALHTQMKESQAKQVATEKRHTELQNQMRQFDVEIQKKTAQKTSLESGLKKAEAQKANWIKELAKLKSTYETELGKMREKVDAEYARQIAAQEAYFQEQREQETLALTHLQKKFEVQEEKLIRQRIALVHERVWGLVTERAVLYGVEKLKENGDFKADLGQSIDRALTEEFEFRRREIMTKAPIPSALLRKQRRSQLTTRYAGWALSLCLLALLAYTQVASNEGVHESTSKGAALLEEAPSLSDALSSNDQ